MTSETPNEPTKKHRRHHVSSLPSLFVCKDSETRTTERLPQSHAGIETIKRQSTKPTRWQGGSLPITSASCHPPKLLIRKSATSACSGASTLKDQQLGRVAAGEGGGEERERRSGGEARPASECCDVLQRGKMPRECCTLPRNESHAGTPLPSLLLPWTTRAKRLVDVGSTHLTQAVVLDVVPDCSLNSLGELTAAVSLMIRRETHCEQGPQPCRPRARTTRCEATGRILRIQQNNGGEKSSGFPSGTIR